MSKEELEEVIEYEEDYIEEKEELSDVDKVEQDNEGQVKFKSVDHHKRAEANEVESDGEIATYANYALEYFGYRCALSGEKIVVFDIPVERENNQRITTNLSAEHIVALTTGGNDIIPNIVPTVLQYNIQKNGYYILDWWSKAKDINGNSIYSPEKLLKLVNYMLKSLQARKDLGIKKQPREYRKRLLTPNEIDKFLMQEENAKELLSDIITATTELEDGKNILTQIPQQEGEIPSLAKQKVKETKITEAMFLTDALDVLGKEEKIPQGIITKLQNMYKEVEGEIPFEIEIRKNILYVLEQIGIENNKYTVANDLLINSDILERVRAFDNSEIQNIIQEYITNQVEELKEILSVEQVILAISNMPELLYNKLTLNRIKFWKEKRPNGLEDLLKKYTVTDELLDIIIILKENGINLAEITVGRTLLEDLLKEKVNKTEILNKLKEVSEGINKKGEKWPIGRCLSNQKNINLVQLTTAINREGIELNQEEKKIIVEKESSQERSQRITKEFVQVLKILKENGINLVEIKSGRSLLEDLVKEKVNKEEIINRLKEVSDEINEKGERWSIGQWLSNQKSRNLEQLKIEITQEEIELSKEELKVILEKETSQEKSQRLTKEFVQVLKVLKESGINLTEIKQRSKLKDVLKENSNKILEKLEEISELINENGEEWLIGRYLSHQKDYNTERLKFEIEQAGINLSKEEIKVILEKETSQEKSQRMTKEFVQVLKILKENGINLSEIKVGTSLLEDLLKEEANKEEILKKLKELSEGIDEKGAKWPIGQCLSKEKNRKLEQLKDEIKQAGIKLNDEEYQKLLGKTLKTEGKTTKEASIRITKEFVQVLKILKENGINLAKIRVGTSLLEELLKEKVNKEEIINRLKEVSDEINEQGGKWPIGEKLSKQKNRKIDQLRAEIEQVGIKLSDEEYQKILINRKSKNKIKTIIKEGKGDLYQTMKAGEELETEILMVEKSAERSASDGRGQ